MSALSLSLGPPTGSQGSPPIPAMTVPLALPLTVLVVAGTDELRPRLDAALPAGDTDVVRVADLSGSSPLPREFIDLCIVDASVAEHGSIEAVRRVRRRWPTVGIYCVGCTDIVALLAAGADVALTTSVPADVVVAQLAAAVRRAHTASALLRVTFGDMVYDREARRVWCAGAEVLLTPRELRLFDILFLRGGTPVSMNTLQDYVWKDDSYPGSNALIVYVSYLRRKLRGSRLAMVETIRGVGYRLTNRSD